MKHFIASLFLFASLAVASAAGPRVGSTAPALGGLLPGSSVPKTAGKVVLVDFWASWCAPCKASFVTLSRLHEKYGAKGLMIIGVGVDDEAKDYQAFAQKNQVPFTLVHDSQHKAADYFSPATMPSSYLLDRKGTVRYIHRGFKGAKSEAEYVAEIEALLAE